MGVEQLPAGILAADALQQPVQLSGIVAPALAHLAHLFIAAVQHRQHVQTRHQLHPPIPMAAIGDRQAVAVAIQLHQAGDPPLQPHHLLMGREAGDLAKTLKLLEGLAMAFLLNQRLSQVLASGLEDRIQR